MNPKTIMTWLLGSFVIVSLVTLAIPKGSVLNSKTVDPTKLSSGRVVTVFYFYDSIRCQTCKQIEAYTKATVLEDFKEQVANGSLVWRPINTDESTNTHFLNDYKIMSKSVVLSETKDGKQTRWKNLDKVWEKIKNESDYRTYVRTEVLAYLEGKP